MKKIIQWLCGFCLLAGLLSGCHTKFIQDQVEIYAPEDPELFSTAGIDAQGYRLDAQTEHRIQSQILRSSKSFTISFWFKPEANFEWTTLLSMGRDDRHVMQLATSGNPTGERCGPVSYTHLDVYKRQSRCCCVWGFRKRWRSPSPPS